jgi:wobble nucleotide-excising tRNase
VVFDDHFINANVYSGLVVTSDNRQKLHELILGERGVTLTRRLHELAEKIEEHNSEIRRLSSAISAADRGTLSVDHFCELPPRADIEQAIEGAERELAAIRQQDAIRTTGLLPEIELPSFDVPALNGILAEGLPALDAAALDRLRRHFNQSGAGGEAWVAAGIDRVFASEDGSPTCPFCCQSLEQSSIFKHYQAYFSDEYRLLKERLSSVTTEVTRNHGVHSQADFERTARTLAERRIFWSQFIGMPSFEIDLQTINRTWKSASEGVLIALHFKQNAPLEEVVLSSQTLDVIAEYEKMRLELAHVNKRLQDLASAIYEVKERAAAGDAKAVTAELALFHSIKSRHSPQVSAKSEEYLAAKAAKIATEREREQAQSELNHYRTTVFPGFQTKINSYLSAFFAGFHLDSVTSTLTRGGPTCTYNVVVNNTPVSVSGARESPGHPSFRTTLSAGDRNTLALAFFFSSLDLAPNLGNKIVVIDDPISSLDEHRALTTKQEIGRLVSRVLQVIVLSHNKPFLCRIWESANRNTRSAMTVARDVSGSTLKPWNVDDDCVTEHDRRHMVLREFLAKGLGNPREVAHAIRPVLEAFARVAYAEHFPPGALLGPFRGVCEQRVGTPLEVLSQADIDELRDLTEYANRFHHDTNRAWETEVINDGELQGFVRRALKFTKR